MEPELKSKQARDLFKTIAALKSEDEVADFFRDLCTYSELVSMTERWQVVREVDLGIPYRKIAENTGASTATITRVAHWLHHGMGGYQLMLNRLH